MLFQFDLAALADAKKWLRKRWPAITSSHCDEAIAAALGFRTHAHLRAVMARKPELVRPISDAVFRRRLVVLLRGDDDNSLLAFDKRLEGLPIVTVFPASLNGGISRLHDPLLEAACSVAPERLTGQNHREGVLAAVAVDLRDRRERAKQQAGFHVDAEAGVGVELDHLGENAFQATVEFNCSRDYLFGGNAFSDTTMGLLEAKFESIVRLLSAVRPSDAMDYEAPDTAEAKAVQNDPIWCLGIYIDGISVQVWPNAVGFSRIDESGNFAGRYVQIVDDDTSARIREALRAQKTGSHIDAEKSFQAVCKVVRHPCLPV